jgi:hypothetical protein
MVKVIVKIIIINLTRLLLCPWDGLKEPVRVRVKVGVRVRVRIRIINPTQLLLCLWDGLKEQIRVRV